jgi:predicted nucleic-acid-binding Zn-ribbon protein
MSNAPYAYPPVDPPEVAQRAREAIQRLKERGALRDDLCPQCRVFDWEVDFIAIPSVPLPKPIPRHPSNVTSYVAVGPLSSYIPALTLVCKNCGYTMIYNLKALGLLGGE